MKILKILTYPNKKLRKKAKPITEINIKLKKQINDMFNTMYFHKGIGLAGTQVNIHKSIIVIDISKTKNHKLILINPKIIQQYGFIKTQEGCLSIPKYFNTIKRFANLTLKTTNLEGQKIIFKTKTILSICIQHEIDHLNGKLIIDYEK